MDYPRRISRVREYLARKKLAACLITGTPNIFYLTGLLRVPGILLVDKNASTFFTPAMFLAESRDNPGHKGVEILAYEKFARVLKSLLKTGFIDSETTVARLDSWRGQGRGPWVACPDFVQEIRMVKEEPELVLIRRAGRITRQVAGRVAGRLKEGVTELDIAAEVLYEVRRAGGNAEAFAPVVAFGPNAAHAHHEPGRKRLRKNEPALIDVGAEVAGYKSDATRTLFPCGRSRELREIFRLVREAERRCVAKARPGVCGGAVHTLAVEYFRDRGVEKYFTHGLGHGVGIEIHERPALNAASRDILRANMVFTIEPGLYLPGVGGVRLEDTKVL